jgi:methylmalonyl-CoA mutase N-terminal domain/subunit
VARKRAEVLGNDSTDAHAEWRRDYERQLRHEKVVANRSGIQIKPLYTPNDWNDASYMNDLGYPGQPPMTRGIYATMHRGRTWSQRQLIGLGTPQDYNQRLKRLIDAGTTAISLIPCNSVYRGYDIDEVDPLLVGTCGTTLAVSPLQ